MRLPHFQWINLGHQEFQANGWVARLLRQGLVDLGQSWASTCCFFCENTMVWHLHDMRNTSIIHQGKWSYRVKKTLASAILRPTRRAAIGSASSCCPQRFFFATGWCPYWATAIVFLMFLFFCYISYIICVAHCWRPETWRGFLRCCCFPIVGKPVNHHWDGSYKLNDVESLRELHDSATGCHDRRSKRDPTIFEVWITVSEWPEEVGLPALHCRHGHFRSHSAVKIRSVKCFHHQSLNATLRCFLTL